MTISISLKVLLNKYKKLPMNAPDYFFKTTYANFDFDTNKGTLELHDDYLKTAKEISYTISDLVIIFNKSHFQEVLKNIEDLDKYRLFAKEPEFENHCCCCKKYGSCS